ncbi:amidohydrolase family protein [Parvularcula marina]|uniref:amidohydrolase family protein n=1 Tax=Parvularcula marina TaxID=2292771 RepID=UPI0035175D72
MAEKNSAHGLFSSMGMGLAIMLGGLTSSAAAQDLFIENALLVKAPGETPELTTILIRDGQIADLGGEPPRNRIDYIDAEGRLVTAGLWNSHVHFTAPALAETPQSVMTDMLLRYGFTSVVDTGSDLSQTLSLRERIENGELVGPRILTASGSFVAPDGSPAYLEFNLPELATPEAARAAINAVLDTGADHIKIMSGSFLSPTETAHMDENVICAAAETTHERERLIFSHPQSRLGLTRAVDCEVDVIVHTVPSDGPLGEDLIAQMLAQDTVLIPTLKLWRFELGRAQVPEFVIKQYETTSIGQLREYHESGGKIAFGTDTGYMSDYYPQAEYELMAKGGLEFDDLLVTLTTMPAEKFGGQSGIVEIGGPADLVIYDGNPVETPGDFAHVAYTIQQGAIVFDAENSAP